MYIGTVVAEVNGQPIYADKILAKVDAELSAKAPLLEPNQFREAARSAIDNRSNTTFPWNRNLPPPSAIPQRRNKIERRRWRRIGGRRRSPRPADRWRWRGGYRWKRMELNLRTR